MRKANISLYFNRNFIYRLPKDDFRNVSERMRTSTLLHSTRLHSTLLHSTNVSSSARLKFINVTLAQGISYLLSADKATGVLRQDGGSETLVLMRTRKRYKRKHV